MLKTLAVFLVMIVVMLACDFIWLGFIAKKFYLNNLYLALNYENGEFVPILPAFFIVYLLMVVGIYFFVLPQTGYLYPYAFAYGLLFGFILYGVFNFTNVGVLAHWPVKVSLVDTAWGAFLCAVTSVSGKMVQNYFP